MGEFKTERNLMGGKSIHKGLQVSCYSTALETEKLFDCNTYLHYPPNNGARVAGVQSQCFNDCVWALRTALQHLQGQPLIPNNIECYLFSISVNSKNKVVNNCFLILD